MTDNIIIRPWMLTYTIIFSLLSVSFVYNDFGQYAMAFTAFQGVVYFVIFTGNLLFSMSYISPFIRALWKFVFPLVVLDFIGTGIIDICYGKHAHHSTPALIVTACVIDFVLFFPTFRAHFLLGYGHDEV
jgi:hypothetical protein